MRTVLTWRALSRAKLTVAIAIFAFAIGTGLSNERGSAAEQLRYKLEQGQEVVYRLTQKHEAGEEKPPVLKPVDVQDEKEWRIFVDKLNNDGSWRLYVRTKIVLRNDDGTPRARFDSLDYVDLQPNGMYAQNEQIAVFKRLLPSQLFCRLPDADEESRARWTSTAPLTGNVHEYKLLDRTNDHARISAFEQAIYSEVNEWQSTVVFEFDAKRGLPRKIVDEYKHSDEEGLRRRTTIQLVSDKPADAAWCEQFGREVQPYLDLYAKSVALDELAYRAHSVQACRDARARARELLLEGQTGANLELFADLWKDHLTAHDNDEKWMLTNAAKREQFFAAADQQSTDWTAKQLNGGDFKLAGHRGKVVVLYFWSCGCEFCVLTAPQISKLANDFADAADVRVAGAFVRFGYDDEDGKVSTYAKRVYRDFPSVEGTELAKRYQFPDHGIAYPTTLILDRSGKVRELFVGYAPDLGQRVRKIVDELRAEK